MARIRTIKPEFWQDEKLAPCSPLTRLVFLGLISMADDAGRVIDNTKVIDAFIFPETSATSRGSVGELSRMGRIRREITASGQKIIQIANWERHQKVEKPNLRACLPEIVTEVAEPQEVADEPPNDPDASGKRRGNVGETSGKRRRTIPTTNDLRPTTNDQVRTGRAKEPPDADAKQPWLAPYLDLWLARVGTVTPKRAAAILGPAHTRYGPTDTLAGLRAYLDQPRPPDKPVRLEWFAAEAARWITEAREPLVVDGVLTERGRRLSA